MRKKIRCFLPLALLLCLAGCAAGPRTATGFALNTVVSVTVFGGEPRAAEQALITCAEYERLLSRTVEGSEISALNASAGEEVPLCAETRELLSMAKDWAARSDGLFDVTIAPVSALWDFSGTPHLPDPAALSGALSFVGIDRLTLTGGGARLPAGSAVDLGGIAKGYIAAKMAEELAASGVPRAIVNLGGNVVVFGGEEEPFRIAIQKPFGESGEYAATLCVSSGAVVTSGVYERGFSEGGRYYHHILDPRTGMPAETGLLSVTVVTANAREADAIATVLFLLGEERGAALAEALPDTEAFFLREDGGMAMTSGGARYLCGASDT